MLTGCAAVPTYETIGNVWGNTPMEQVPASIEFGLPDDVQMEVMETTDSCKSYQVGDWMLWTEIHAGGDLLATMEMLTGLDADRLNIISYPQGRYQCHETAWSVCAEEGEYAVRTVVIPYGQYHYCLSLKAPVQDAEQAGNFFSGIVRNVYLNDTAA